MTGSVSQSIKISLYAKEEYAETIADEIVGDNFCDIRFNASYEVNNESVDIEVVETGRFESEPMVLYTRNGDGYPGHYEDDLISESEIYNIVEDYACAHPEYEIEIDHIRVDYRDVA